MGWTAEEILEANPPQQSHGRKQDRSKLERVLLSAQANLDVLADVADEIERRPANHVAALFQLPYPVRLSAGWHRVPTLTVGMTCELSCEVCGIAMPAENEFRLERGEDAAKERPLVTQCIALVPVWGPRTRFHDKYLTHVLSGRNDNPEIVPQRYSWSPDNRPMNLQDYEHFLAKRLLREIIPILRSFLPAYGIASLSEAPVPNRVHAYMAMTAPGRIMYAGDSLSIVRALMQGLAAKPAPVVIDGERLSIALRTRYREFGQFEAQLFALERLRLRGETALALIGSLSLLELLLNRFLRELGVLKAKGKGKLTLNDALKHTAITFFTSEQKAFLDRLREVRNQAVHEKPPERRSLTVGGPDAGRESDGLPATISAADVRRTIELVFEGFRATNLNKSGLRYEGPSQGPQQA